MEGVELSRGSLFSVERVAVVIASAITIALILAVIFPSIMGFNFEVSSAGDNFESLAEAVEMECQSLGNVGEVQSLGTYDLTGIDRVTLTGTGIEASGEDFSGSRPVECDRLRFCDRNHNNCGVQVLQADSEMRIDFYKPDTHEIDVFQSPLGLQGCWIEVYKNRDFAEGAEHERFTENQPNLADTGGGYQNGCVQRYGQSHWNDCVSSFRLASACRVTVFQDRDYGGEKHTFTRSQERLGEVDGPCGGNWNDCVSSLRLSRLSITGVEDACADVTCGEDQECLEGRCYDVGR